MSTNASIFCRNALQELEKSNSYAEDWVRLRMEFYYKYQRGYVFPSFGADFFEVIIDWLINRKDFCEPITVTKEDGTKLKVLPEWEANFNAWLKTERQSK